MIPLKKSTVSTVGELRNFIECITDECSVSFTVATFYLDKTGEGQVTLLPATPSKKPVEEIRHVWAAGKLVEERHMPDGTVVVEVVEDTVIQSETP